MAWITRYVSTIVETRTPRWWWVAFAFTSVLALAGVFAFTYLVSTGVGVWGNNIPTAWGWGITNFVFWIGIAHAGTLISAILLLCRQPWRTSINRAAEAMTLFAVVCAGIYPVLHLGRAWMVWFMAPLPNSFAIWPNFRSPLMWDAFAVGTYLIVSVLFWYTGLIPDLATLRDRSRHGWRRYLFGLFALGWCGSGTQWACYRKAYLLLAGLCTPLVISVHSIVSCDFAAAILPGWHSTLFPPYFVVGAIFGGCAMVLTLLIPLRVLYPPLHDLITNAHVQSLARLVLFTSSLLGFSYALEIFLAWYSGDPYERLAFWQRTLAGPARGAFWAMLGCNVLVPQLLWWRSVRLLPWLVWIVAQFANVGMWLERFVIIPGSLMRGPVPSSWGYFQPTWVDILCFIGTVGLFLSLFLLFVRWIPLICMHELKMQVEVSRENENQRQPLASSSQQS